MQWKHLKKPVFFCCCCCFFLFFFVFFLFWGGGGKNNPGLSPDYQMVCSIHIEFIECLGREIGNKLH